MADNASLSRNSDEHLRSIEDLIARGIDAGFPSACDCFVSALKILRRNAVATNATSISKPQRDQIQRQFDRMHVFLNASGQGSSTKDSQLMFGGVKYLVRSWTQPRSEEAPFIVQGAVLQAAILCQMLETALTFLCLMTWERQINSDVAAARIDVFRDLLDTSAFDMNLPGDA